MSPSRTSRLSPEPSLRASALWASAVSASALSAVSASALSAVSAVSAFALSAPSAGAPSAGALSAGALSALSALSASAVSASAAWSTSVSLTVKGVLSRIAPAAAGDGASRSAPLLGLGGPLGRRPLARRPGGFLARSRGRGSGGRGRGAGPLVTRGLRRRAVRGRLGHPNRSLPRAGRQCLAQLADRLLRLLRRRVVADDVTLLGESPEVAREPVEQHAEREVEQQPGGQHADRDKPQHQSLDGGRGALGHRGGAGPDK